MRCIRFFVGVGVRPGPGSIVIAELLLLLVGLLTQARALSRDSGPDLFNWRRTPLSGGCAFFLGRRWRCFLFPRGVFCPRHFGGSWWNETVFPPLTLFKPPDSKVNSQRIMDPGSKHQTVFDDFDQSCAPDGWEMHYESTHGTLQTTTIIGNSWLHSVAEALAKLLQVVFTNAGVLAL